MSNSCPCETLWLYNPAALVGKNLLVNDVCESNNINAFTRALLLGLVLSGLLYPLLGISALALVILILLFLYRSWLFAKIIPSERTVLREQKGKEGFEANIRPDMGDFLAYPVPNVPIAMSPAATIVTRPSATNPFMNVLLDELTFNPTRAPADSSTDPRNQVILDDFFRVQWTSDPTDVFGRSQSQRQFYTMPSTSVPNDRASYQNWLYLIPGATCKEGGRDACYPATNGGPVTWLSQPN